MPKAQEVPSKLVPDRRNRSYPFARIVILKKLKTGLRTNSAGLPYTLLLRTVPTFGLLP